MKQLTISDSEKTPGIFQSGILYSIVILLFLYIGSRVQSWSFSGGIIITEFILILLPVIIYTVIFKYDWRRLFRIHRPGFMNLFLVFWIMIFALPVVGLLNLLYTWIIYKIFGNISVPQIPVPDDIKGYFTGLFVMGVSAGICEEILFRGFIFRGLEKLGTVKALLLTAVLFGIMHLDIQKLFGTFLLGVLIGFIVYRSNSIINGMFAHLINNSLAFTLMFAAAKLKKFTPETGTASDNPSDYFRMIGDLSSAQIFLITLFWGILFVMFAVCFGALIFAFFSINKSKTEIIKPASTYRSLLTLKNMAPFFPGLLFAGFIYIIQMMTLGGAISKDTASIILGAIGIR